jgi:hypothetical protein
MAFGIDNVDADIGLVCTGLFHRKGEHQIVVLAHRLHLLASAFGNPAADIRDAVLALRCQWRHCVRRKADQGRAKPALMIKRANPALIGLLWIIAYLRVAGHKILNNSSLL